MDYTSDFNFAFHVTFKVLWFQDNIHALINVRACTVVHAWMHGFTYVRAYVLTCVHVRKMLKRGTTEYMRCEPHTGLPHVYRTQDATEKHHIADLPMLVGPIRNTLG